MSSVDPIILQHYDSLRVYLAPYVASQKTQSASSNSNGQPNASSNSSSNQRASAREKLTRLTLQQFQELSTDVFDEMSRRQESQDTVPFLPVKDEFHPKRNQARQKLATLPNSRFKDLASDVYYELERRHPELLNATNGTSNIQQQPQHAILPPPVQIRAKSDVSSILSAPPLLAIDNVKDQSSMVSPTGSGAEISFASLDNLMADLGNMLNSTSTQSTSQPYSSMTNGIGRDSAKSVVDDELRRLRAKVAQLESMQVDTSKYDNSNARVNELEDRLAAVVAELKEKDAIIEKLSEDASKAKENYESLQEDYNQQQMIANDIRAEATNLLDEIKSMSRKNDELAVALEREQAEVNRLKEENEKLQKLTDAAGSRNAERNLRDSPSFDYLKESLQYVEGGVIKPQRIATYQEAVSDLMRATRSDQPPAVLVAMKAIVLACKGITEDSEHFEQNEQANLMPEFVNRLAVIKTKLSGALTSLMNAAKTHSQSYNGNMPPVNGTTIVAVESAATNLTAVILDLVRCLKSRDESGSFNRGHSGASIVNGHSSGIGTSTESVHSTDGDKSYDVDELKGYLEKQTDVIVQAIQSLLYAMRQNTPVGNEFKDTVNNITRIVDSLIKVSRRTLSSPSASSKPAFASSGDHLLQQLSAANSQFSTLGDSMVNSPQSKTLKQQVAGSSYEIAKFVKELISQLD